ncbi:MAG: hypothetical protein LUH10_08625 [Tannerellaceae bacterium]|nr:hypothetical protein [Tannerellaceae bacterium]
MLLKGNTTTPEFPDVVNDTFINLLITNNQYTEAYTLLSGCNQLTIAGSYNLILCLIQAEEYTQAILKADEVLRLIQTRVPQTNRNENETVKMLRTKQCRLDTHRAAVTLEYVKTFPGILRESVLRLKIDCYRATGNWNKVIETASQLICKEYKNVETALQEAENKLK